MQINRSHSVFISFILASFLLAAAFILHFFPFVQVHESSMSPTLAEGDLIILSRLAYTFQDIQADDVLVFREPEQISTTYVIKRCVLVPGMAMEWRGEELYIPHLQRYVNIHTNIYKMLWQYKKIPEGFIFVLGDNSEHSVDSRNYGLVPIQNIRGKAIWGL